MTGKTSKPGKMRKSFFRRRALFLSLTLTLPLWMFNNCSDVDFAASDSSSRVIIKDIDDERVKVSQGFQVAQKPLDILFVVDNSGSMTNYQRNMSQRIEGFLRHIEGLDWQIAVTSTDPLPMSQDANRQEVPWGDGQFRHFGDNPNRFILRPSEVSNLAEAERLLGQAIEMGSNGDGDERGIRATYRAIERRASSPAHGAFFRETSALAVVLISDEDECSNGSCDSNHNPEKSRIENLLKLVEDTFGKDKLFVFNSLIHQDGRCSQPHRAAREGRTYRRLSEATNGLVGLVCATDYGQQLSELGLIVKQMASDIKLVCNPLDTSGNGRPNVDILAGSTPISPRFEIRRDVLHFPDGLPEGQYRLEYICRKEEAGS